MFYSHINHFFIIHRKLRIGLKTKEEAGRSVSLAYLEPFLARQTINIFTEYGGVLSSLNIYFSLVSPFKCAIIIIHFERTYNFIVYNTNAKPLLSS